MTSAVAAEHVSVYLLLCFFLPSSYISVCGVYASKAKTGDFWSPLVLSTDFKIDSKHKLSERRVNRRTTEDVVTGNCGVCTYKETTKHVCRTMYLRYPVTSTSKVSDGCPVGDVTRQKGESNDSILGDRVRPAENISVIVVRFRRLANTTWPAYDFRRLSSKNLVFVAVIVRLLFTFTVLFSRDGMSAICF